MSVRKIEHCPGTLAVGHETYCNLALKRMFNGKRVQPFLPYLAPNTDEQTDALFDAHRARISISGVQEKVSVLLEKNKLRLVNPGERGQYILKPIPRGGKNADEMPANEHLTMQIARQIYDIETAENALIFFKDGQPAYLTKRFDMRQDGRKWAQEDFAALAGLTPQTHGANYKYRGNYLDLFMLMKKYVRAYPVEAPKLFKLIAFNYLFSNGDAHFKNFSLIETPQGDFKLSPAYDVLNSRIHIEDTPFALEQGLLPPHEALGSVRAQFSKLGQLAEIQDRHVEKMLSALAAPVDAVQQLIHQSYLSERTKRSYAQAFLTRLGRLK
jgi:serine/threonine-protein kinase HipA